MVFLLCIYPMNMKRKQDVVIRAPRLDGDNIPSIATTMKQFDHIFKSYIKWMSKQGMCSTVWITIIPIMWKSFLQFRSHRFHTGLVISFHKIISIILTDNDENHAEELGARSQQGAKNHGILRWAEHITMDILPTRFLHCIFLLVPKREKNHVRDMKKASNQSECSILPCHLLYCSWQCPSSASLWWSYSGCL